ncbi:MAG: hypothetical protein JW699_02345 [Chitinispirillaceae bacterium]|nr:hypothetical protein [Chitinispirillaceae bacterium]
MRHQRILIVSDFRGRMRVFSVVCSFSLCCCLGLVLPLHHHEDGRNHPECAACVAQSQPAEAVTVFCLSFVLLPVFTMADFEDYFYGREYRAVYHSRAPPSVS